MNLDNLRYRNQWTFDRRIDRKKENLRVNNALSHFFTKLKSTYIDYLVFVVNSLKKYGYTYPTDKSTYLTDDDVRLIINILLKEFTQVYDPDEQLLQLINELESHKESVASCSALDFCTFKPEVCEKDGCPFHYCYLCSKKIDIEKRVFQEDCYHWSCEDCAVKYPICLLCGQPSQGYFISKYSMKRWKAEKNSKKKNKLKFT